MTRNLTRWIAMATLAAAPCAVAQDVVSQDDFAKACADLADKGERTMAGADAEWLFLGQELRHLATGEFWQKDAEEVTAAKVSAAPFFIALHEKLEALGVQFVVVPVPAKGAIYPDKLIEGATEASVPASAPFLKTLSDAGITVIDLEPELRAARKVSGAPESYCKTDSHPSPHTCEMIAGKVAQLLSAGDWVKAAAAGAGVTFSNGEPADVLIKGDLIPDGKKASWTAEKLPVRTVVVDGEMDGAKSPVILVGDSHAQIFSEGGEMLLRGAGVVDHLQADLGFPVHVVTSLGSAMQAHVYGLYKDAEFWEGRKAVVWLASARSFTRERKWRSLPRLPK